MRMLNMKRFFIALAGTFGLLLLMVVSFVYFFNVNDHSKWISTQIKQITGYDLRFEHVESHWTDKKSIVLTGVSLYQEQQAVLAVKRIELKIDQLDFWQRQLIVKEIYIQGVESNIQLPFQLTNSTQQAVEPTPGKHRDTLAWQGVSIRAVKIEDINVSLQRGVEKAIITNASLTLNELKVIKDNQLQVMPLAVDLMAKFETIQLSNTTQKLRVEDLVLSSKVNLVQQQGQLELLAGSSFLQVEQQQALALNTLNIDLKWNRNHLLLEQLALNAFSGRLVLTAEATLALRLLPAFNIGLNEITVKSLLAQDMYFDLTSYLSEAKTEQTNNNMKQENVPVKSLFVERVQLKNISVESKSKQLPLKIEQLEALLQHFYVLQDNQLVNPLEYTEQAGSFTFKVKSLGIQEVLLEQMEMAGSLTKDDQDLLLLKKLLNQ